MNPTYRGKVRDLYDFGDSLLMVASDRISAFDVVFPELIPGKGKVLNQISRLWFEKFQNIPNHILSYETKDFPKEFQSEEFAGRSVLVRKCKRIDFECVVRSYLSGSGFKEYKQSGTLAGVSLPLGLQESSKLGELHFTPAIKNDQGHDENISAKEMEEKIGKKLFEKIVETSFRIFAEATRLLSREGILLCDTKFEFGLKNEELVLIDEILTPDSSRYWEASTYKVGTSPPSLDKQILRNFLESTSWNKIPPPPKIPEEIQLELSRKYEELQERITKCLQPKSASH